MLHRLTSLVQRRGPHTAQKYGVVRATVVSSFAWLQLATFASSSSSGSPSPSKVSVVLDGSFAGGGAGQSQTLAAQATMRQRRLNGDPVYNWGLGQSPFSAPRVIREAMVANAHQKDYVPAEGIPGIGKRIAATYGIPEKQYHIREENVLVAPGLKQLLMDVQRCWGGDIIHVSPCWVSYAEQTRLLGKEDRVTTVYTKQENQYKLTPQDLHDVFGDVTPQVPRLMIFNHPSNPVGYAYTRDELEALSVAIRQYGIVVFADEVYLGNIHDMLDDASDGHHHRSSSSTSTSSSSSSSSSPAATHRRQTSLAEFCPDHVIRATSLSKEFNCGGYRLGYCCFPDALVDLKQAMSQLASSTYSCAPVPQQYAAMAALERYEEIQIEVRAQAFVLSLVGAHMYDLLLQRGLGVTIPDAAWYLWLDFTPFQSQLLQKKSIETSSQLSQCLIDDLGWITVAGAAFRHPPSSLFLRASYVDFDGDAALSYHLQHPEVWEECRNQGDTHEVRSRLGSQVPYLSHMRESVDALHDWLQQ